MYFLAKKLSTGLRVLRRQGAAAVGLVVAHKIGRLSRVMPGGLIRVGPCLFRSDAESREFLLDATYEDGERFASKRYVRRDIPVVEFGGSLGVVSCLLNRRLRIPSRHVVVEANPEVLPILLENRDRNRCKFEILHGAAGGEGKSVRIYVGNGALTSSSMAAAPRSLEVPAIMLADILESRSFDRCALICDIEGAELNFIRREINTLRSRVEMFVIEFHPRINGSGPVEEAHGLLRQHGFAETWQQRDVFVYRNTALAGRP